jgi:ClpP class serine protease
MTTSIIVVEAKQTPEPSNKITTNDVIEVNPDYDPNHEPDDDDDDDDNGGSSDDDSDNDATDSDDDDNDDVENENEDDSSSKVTTKKRLAKAMKKTRRTSKNAIVFLKKNRAQLTVAIALIAFRREIAMMLAHLTKKTTMRNKVTSILKLILFVNFIRRLQSGSLMPSSSDNSPGYDGEGNTSAFVLFLTSINPLLGFLFSTFKSTPYNPAYVPPINQHFAFERVNELFVKDGMALQKSIRSKHEGFEWPKSTSSSGQHFTDSTTSSSKKNVTTSSTQLNKNETIIIINWTGLGTSLPMLDVIRDQVSFLMSEYRKLALLQQKSTDSTTSGNEDNINNGMDNDDDAPKLEVVVLLESPGGEVGAYGLAASQLLRLRNAPGITLTICVDKVAASGGYMLACTASDGKLFAAPFALVGSIGVLGQILNVHDLLQEWKIKPMVFRGGKDKSPLSMTGEVTEEGKIKTQEMINATHRAFLRHVLDCRPVLAEYTDKIGNGDVWLGMDAIDLGLIDQIKTSDEYIQEKMDGGTRVLKMVRLVRSTGGFPFGRSSPEYTASLQRTATEDPTTYKLGPSSSSLFNLGTAKSWIEKLLAKALVSVALLVSPVVAKTSIQGSLE